MNEEQIKLAVDTGAIILNDENIRIPITMSDGVSFLRQLVFGLKQGHLKVIETPKKSTSTG